MKIVCISINTYHCQFSADNDKSSAQRKYEQERFRVQPGKIEEYSLGRGSIAQQEAQKVNNNKTTN